MGTKNKTRKIPKTVLMVGEGAITEQTWLNHLKKLFEQSEIATTVEPGKGSAIQTLRFALNEVKERAAEGYGYDRVLVLMDTDESWGDPNNAKDRDQINQAIQNELTLLGTDPCLEGYLLRLLEASTAPAPEIVGQWRGHKHHTLIEKIYTRFHNRIPDNATRPTNSLCNPYKTTIAGHLGGTIDDIRILTQHFPKQTLKTAAQHDPVLTVIIQHFSNAQRNYASTITIG